ncbi:FG-GAP repeat domain-containing protein [Dyadobacter subterraneus]|uniref:VCBS repeat-containing protein n=1 Tax=Dyadobacter subterraneus TaxID=2773304 RepID=A0ABR9WEI8_9BACT|nr:VCBS repeat-containing protein [Dyadobacter subterraneus]MBE9463913.1 VCBS repeat-containing protein [Dyadobacter subterraneus]
MKGFKETNRHFSFCKFILAVIAVTYLTLSAQTQSTAIWKRHAIDNSLKGADGVRFEDANGDGLQDIVTGWEQSGLVRIYFNPGKTQVKSKWNYVTVGLAPNVEDAVLVDLDGDGSKDVISSCEGNTMRVNVHWAPAPGKNYSDSTLWKTEIFPVTEGKFQWMFAVPQQIDGVNGVDLILGGKKDSDKFPQPYIGWLKAPKNPRKLSEWQWIPLAKVSWVMSILIADINGDKQPDIFYSDRKQIPQGVKWLENPGKPAINGKWKNHIVGDSTHIVKFMDLNDLDSDGKEDAVVVTEDDQIHFYKKLDNKGLHWEKHVIDYPDNVGGGKAVTVADVDQDGKKDLVISCEGAKGGKSGVYYLRYVNSVFDKKWQRNEISGPEGIKYDLIPAFDFDQDGDLDFVSTEENNNSAGGFGGLGIIWYENPLK